MVAKIKLTGMNGRTALEVKVFAKPFLVREVFHLAKSDNKRDSNILDKLDRQFHRVKARNQLQL